MKFSLFVEKGKGAIPREETLKDVALAPEFKPEDREALFRKIANEHVNSLDSRTFSTIRKFTNTNDPDRRTLFLPEVAFQNKILTLLVAGKINDLERFVRDYTTYFIEAKNKTKKDEIRPEEAKNVHEYIDSMLLGVEKVAEVVEDIQDTFSHESDYAGYTETIATNDTLDTEHKIDVVQVITNPNTNEIAEVVLVQIKRGTINDIERSAVEKAHAAYVSSLDTFAEAYAFQDIQEPFVKAKQETVEARRIQLLDALHQKYGFFGAHFCEQPLAALEERGVTDALITTMLADVGADFTLDELAELVRTHDSQEIFNIAEEEHYEHHIALLEDWAAQHVFNQEDLYEKIPETNIAKAHVISSVIVDRATSFQKAYRERKILKTVRQLTMVA